MASPQLFCVILPVVASSQTTAWPEYHVCPAFVGHVLLPGHSAQAERVEQDTSPARTRRRWCVCDPARQGASPMLTFQVGAHPEVFETPFVVASLTLASNLKRS